MAFPKPTRTAARRIDCHDEQAGCVVSDPYRWMEEDSSELRMWLNEQHEYTKAQLLAQPTRERLHARIKTLMQMPTLGTVIKAGTKYFFRQRLDGHELSALYCRDRSDGAVRLLVDPNELSPNHSITLGNVYPSPDGSLIAYRLSRFGRSDMDLYIMDVATREVLPVVIPADVNPVAHAWHTKNGVAWLNDSSGFYYTRCADNTPDKERRFHHKLYFHRLGEDPREDTMVFGEFLRREQTPYPTVSSDGRYLGVLIQDLSGATPGSDLYLLDRNDPEGDFAPIVKEVDAFINSVAFHRDKLYIRTTHTAPLGKLIVVDLADIASGSSVLIPEASGPLRNWATIKDYLFVETLENVSSRLRVFDLNGSLVKQIELPGMGSINGFSAEPEWEELLFSFSSFLIPRTVYCIDLDTLTYRLYHREEGSFDPEDFEVEQIWLESCDKTRIPMFLVHRKGFERNADTATVIHGYGGFGVSLLPSFTPHLIPFLESGGIYAVLNARGGGEFGEAWHRAGMRENKQNTFNDFIAAGEWLITNGYTNTSKLGCFGWSNGGLSVNAVAVQRSGLWKAIVAGAPVTDMARFHLAYGGRHWIADYGSPEDVRDLKLLMQYSPYHTLPQALDAPAILTIAPDNDDRVAAWHSYKMHAAWLEANSSGNPILLRGEEKAGHRGSPAATRIIDLYTDIWTFFFWQLGLSW